MKQSNMETLYHLLGICGEHSHPNLVNLGFILATCYLVYKISKKRIYE